MGECGRHVRAVVLQDRIRFGGKPIAVVLVGVAHAVTFAGKATIAPPLLAVLVGTQAKLSVCVVIRIAAVIFRLMARAGVILLNKHAFVLPCLHRSSIARAALPAHAGWTTAAADSTPLLLVPAATLHCWKRYVYGIQDSRSGKNTDGSRPISRFGSRCLVASGTLQGARQRAQHHHSMSPT